MVLPEGREQLTEFTLTVLKLSSLIKETETLINPGSVKFSPGDRGDKHLPRFRARRGDLPASGWSPRSRVTQAGDPVLCPVSNRQRGRSRRVVYLPIAIRSPMIDRGRVDGKYQVNDCHAARRQLDMGAYFKVVNPAKRQYLDPGWFGEGEKFSSVLRGDYSSGP